MNTIKRSAFLDTFVCTGASCEDTCCIGWGMQVDDGTWERYTTTAPDIAQDVTEEHGIRVMKRDSSTGTCVRFDNGLCGIQSQKGTDYLGDACHFFPRITRNLGQHTLMTAALSCPEITRIALKTDQNILFQDDSSISRLPHTIKNYLPQDISSDDSITIHRQFLELTQNETRTAERTLAVIGSTARSLVMLPHASWAAATPFYINTAEAKLIPAQQHPEDPFNLLHALAGLVDASSAKGRPRLEQTISDIEQALDVTLNRKHGAITTTERSLDAMLMMEHQWRVQWSTPLQPILRRWLGVQLSNTLFPFAGFGNGLLEVVTLLSLRFAITRLALMSFCYAHQQLPTEDDTIRIIQSLSRFLDHLTSPELSIQICQETGWIRESRLRAIIGDI